MKGCGWPVDVMWLVCGWCVQGVWKVFGGVCLALGVLQRCQATVLPLWQLRGESQRPWLASAEGLLAGRLLQSFSRVPGMARARLSLPPEESVSCLRSHGEISRRPLCPVSVTDTIAHILATGCLPLSSPINRQGLSPLPYSLSP